MKSILHYSMRDPSDGNVRAYNAQELRQVLAASGKPVFFACIGMDGFSYDKKDPARHIRFVEEILSAPGEAHVVNVASNDTLFLQENTFDYWTAFGTRLKAQSGKKALIEEYEREVRQPTTFGIHIVKELFEPMLKDAHSPAEIRQILSQFNFFGFSFGAVIVAETLEYLHAMLRSKGLSAEDTHACLCCLGRLGVGTMYPIGDLRVSLPGVDYNSAQDAVIQRYGNTAARDKSDSKIMGIERREDTILLTPFIGDDGTRYIDIEATEKTREGEKKNFSTELSHKTQSVWKALVGKRLDLRGHTSWLYMQIDRLRLNPLTGRARYTAQSFPGAEIVNGYVQDLARTSLQAAQSKTPRDTRLLLDGLYRKLESPAARDALGENLRKSQMRFSKYFGVENTRR